jgi:hypothetical protein
MSTRKIDVAHLAQNWLHSHEEDTPSGTVYRPVRFPFPPSRGRKGFHLRPDGSLILTKPGASDRPDVAAGTWKLSGEQLELSPAAAATQTLCIESVEPDRLVVSKAPVCKTG